MADYSTADTNANASLNEATDGGMVEEYQIGNRRVKRGKLVDQIKATAMLEGLAARRSHGGFARAAKITIPKT